MNELQNLVDLLNGYSTDDISYHVNYAIKEENCWTINVKPHFKVVSEKLPSILDIVERLEGYRGKDKWKVQEVKKNNAKEIAQNLGVYTLKIKYIGGKDEEKN